MAHQTENMTGVINWDANSVVFEMSTGAKASAYLSLSSYNKATQSKREIGTQTIIQKNDNLPPDSESLPEV